MLLSLLTLFPRGSLWSFPLRKWNTQEIQWQCGNKLPCRLKSTVLDLRIAMQSPLNDIDSPTNIHPQVSYLLLCRTFSPSSFRRQGVGKFRYLILRHCYLQAFTSSLRCFLSVSSLCTTQVTQALGQSRRNKVLGAFVSRKDSTSGIWRGIRGSWHINKMIKERLPGLGRWFNE